MYTKHAQNRLKTKIINFINLVGYKNGRDVGKVNETKQLTLLNAWSQTNEKSKPKL